MEEQDEAIAEARPPVQALQGRKIPRTCRSRGEVLDGSGFTKPMCGL
jgi:hypothetical protein